MNHFKKLHIGGEEVMGEDALCVKIQKFYKDRYSEPCPFRPTVDGIHLGTISAQERDILDGDFSKDEVWFAISTLGEIDLLTLGFYSC